MGKDVQGIMDSDAYHALFPDTLIPPKGKGYRGANGFGILGHNGTYRAAGVGGPITGYGFEFGIIDDPVKNRAEADSHGIRSRIQDWYTSTFSTRQEKDACILFTMTRWHEMDLAGWLIDLMKTSQYAEQWEILSLPAISETNRDPRDPREEGEPLWPNKYSLEALLTMRASMGERDWASLQQQRPSPLGGTIFQSEWYDGRNRFDWTDSSYRNASIGRYVSFDTAMKVGPQNDYTGYTVGELSPDYMLRTHIVDRERVEFPELLDLIMEVAMQQNMDGKLLGVIIEDKSSGTSAYQTLSAIAPPWLKRLLIPFMPTVGKEARAEKAAVWCRNGTVLLPYSAYWLPSFEQEFFSFPSSAHKDRVDSFVQLILFLEHQLSSGFSKRMGWQTSIDPSQSRGTMKETLIEMARKSARITGRRK
jgi:predicted phage terminase large subunit-like protein